MDDLKNKNEGKGTETEVKPGPIRQETIKNDQKETPTAQSAVPGAPNETPQVRLASAYVMMTVTGPDKNGKLREGGIGYKIGERWTWLSYTEQKSIIDMCMENKDLFNAELELARQRTTQLTDL